MTTNAKLKKLRRLPGPSGRWVVRLFAWRKAHGVSQGELARRVGLAKDTIVSWEIGRNRMGRMSAWRVSTHLGFNLLSRQGERITPRAVVEPLMRQHRAWLRRRLGV